MYPQEIRERAHIVNELNRLANWMLSVADSVTIDGDTFNFNWQFISVDTSLPSGNAKDKIRQGIYALRTAAWSMKEKGRQIQDGAYLPDFGKFQVRIGSFYFGNIVRHFPGRSFVLGQNWKGFNSHSRPQWQNVSFVPARSRNPRRRPSSQNYPQNEPKLEKQPDPVIKHEMTFDIPYFKMEPIW